MNRHEVPSNQYSDDLTTKLRSRDRNCLHILTFQQADSSFHYKMTWIAWVHTHSDQRKFIAFQSFIRNFLFSGSFQINFLFRFSPTKEDELTAGSDKMAQCSPTRVWKPRSFNSGQYKAARTIDLQSRDKVRNCAWVLAFNEAFTFFTLLGNLDCPSLHMQQPTISWWKVRICT